jgi:TonB family protein
MRACALLVAAAIGTSCPVFASGPQNATPDLTLGEVLLLVNSADPGAPAALRGALASRDPVVRTAAGRVIAVVPHGALRPALIGALAREQDAATGAEFVRDILHLSNGADLAFVEPQAKRLGQDAVLALAVWLARMQPAQFGNRLAQLISLTDSAGPLSALVTVAALQHPDQAQAIRRQWMAVAPAGTWNDVLAAALAAEGVTSADESLVVDALEASRANVREETVWLMLQVIGQKQSVTAKAAAAAGRPRDDATAWEALGRELIARGAKPPAAPEDRHELLLAQGLAHIPDLHRIQSAPQLTVAERDAILSLAPLPKGLTWQSKTVLPETRTLRPFAPNAIGATFTAANCEPAARGIAEASLAYAADGTPLRIEVISAGLSKPCLTAWTALLRTAMADDGEPVMADQPQAIVLPLNESFLSCVAADTRAAPSAPPVIPTGRIQEPRRLKDVKPEYPVAAQSRRIQGIIVVEAVISRAGCVSSARVLRSIPFLDAPAVAAVSGWLFTPTVLDGSPVPVIMTVTVNFTLQ